MPARVTCPHCRHDLQLPEVLYHRPAQCPVCDGAFRVNWRAAELGETDVVDAVVPVSGEEDRRPCRFCGRSVKRQVQKCPYCGEWLKRGTGQPGAER